MAVCPAAPAYEELEDGTSLELSSDLVQGLGEEVALATRSREHHEAAHRNLISTLESLLYVEDAGASSPHIPGLHAMQSTVGMIINGCTVTDLLVGSPAMSSRQIERGDVILAVDGQPATAHNIVHLIHSPDIPGTCVTLTMQQRDGGERDLTLTRMASAKAAERKKLFDLFASLRVHLLQHSGDREGGLILEQCMQQWASLAQEEYEHQHAVANRVSTLYRETSQQVPTSWASTRLQTELIQSLSLDLQRAQLLELKLKVDREQLTLAQQGLELAHKDLKKAASSMQEYRAMLNQSEAALAEHKDAANKEHQKAAQVVEQLREALAKVRRDNSQKQDVTADRDSAAMEIVMHERDRARADLEESKRQLERVLQVQARSDSLVQVLQNKLRELEDKSADFKASAKRAGVGIVVDTHVDGTLRVRNLVRGGAADEEGSLKPDDILLRIDGTVVKDPEQAFTLVHGFEGTTVRIAVERPTTSEVVETVLRRKCVSGGGVLVPGQSPPTTRCASAFSQPVTANIIQSLDGLQASSRTAPLANGGLSPPPQLVSMLPMQHGHGPVPFNPSPPTAASHRSAAPMMPPLRSTSPAPYVPLRASSPVSVSNMRAPSPSPKPQARNLQLVGNNVGGVPHILPVYPQGQLPAVELEASRLAEQMQMISKLQAASPAPARQPSPLPIKAAPLMRTQLASPPSRGTSPQPDQHPQMIVVPSVLSVRQRT